jgi:putative ABC transport system ATP-binding protein
MEELISLSEVFKTYDMGPVQVKALDGVSIQIARGDYVAVMGPSGSGKSTLMNLIGCLDTPSSGSYMLKGREIARMDDDELARIRTARSASSSRPSTCSPAPMRCRTWSFL